MTDTRQKLVDIAFERFGRSGFHAVGLDAIIADAGVSKQTFYNHFESKEALILAVLERRGVAEGEVIGELFKSIAGASPKARLYALIDVLDAWFNRPDWRGCIFVRAAAEFPLRTEPAHKMAATHFQTFRGAIEEMAANAGAKDPSLLADQLALLVDGLVSVRHVTGQENFTAIARTMAHQLLDQQFAPAIAPKPPAPARGRRARLSV